MRRGAAALAVLAALALAGCDRGDWAGSVERVAREAVNGWDMWETDAVQPHEKPMPPSVSGSAPQMFTDGFVLIIDSHIYEVMVFARMGISTLSPVVSCKGKGSSRGRGASRRISPVLIPGCLLM